MLLKFQERRRFWEASRYVLEEYMSGRTQREVSTLRTASEGILVAGRFSLSILRQTLWAHVVVMLRLRIGIKRGKGLVDG